MKISLPNADRRNYQRVVNCAARLLLALVLNVASAARADWSITNLSVIGHAPSINNSGEIVWCDGTGRGIYSSVRGRLTYSGLFPHLANSGEVVYVNDFGSGVFDLMSTTRGQLTFGGTIRSLDDAFDVNSSGEVVYLKMDATGYLQVFSTTRGQITTDATGHYGVCINDLGEIVWGQTLPGPRGGMVSSTRGILPDNYGGYPQDLNNHGDVCFSGSLAASGGYSSPHIFSSVYGAVIPDPNRYQWYGSINDAGDLVWGEPDKLYLGHWIGPSRPVISASPRTQTAELGATVSFRARADGASPLTFQWFFNDTNFVGTTTNSLVLTNVQPGNVGVYSFVVTNRFGAATSAPAALNVIAAVPRRTVMALALNGTAGMLLNLESSANTGPGAAWQAFDTVLLTNTAQWYFDLAGPGGAGKFYRAWHTNHLAPPAALHLHLVPALSLVGTVGASVRIDCLNQFGPIDAWSAIDTVTLSSSPQIYFDVSAIDQPPRLWRMVTLGTASQ